MTRSVLFFGSYDATLHPRVAVLRDGLAARGWQVEELNVPLGAATADKVAAAGSVRAAGSLAGRQLRSWRRLVSQWRASRPDPDVVVVGYLGHADVHLARALFRRSTIVLDHLVGLADTVADRQLGGSATARGLAVADRAALRAADVVVVDTPEQLAALPADTQPRAVVVPVGAEPAWYAAAANASPTMCMETPVGSPDPYTSSGGVAPLRVVFFGLFTPLQGVPTIAAAIDRLRDQPVTFTLIGTGQDHAEARRIVGADPSVGWVDWVAGEELPAVVADYDVCLGIFGTGPKAQRVVPTKVYQGMAAGCAVVTGDTPAVAALGEGVLRVPCGDPVALADQLRLLAEDRPALKRARERARRTARSFTAEAAVADLDARLAGDPPVRRLPPLTTNAWLRWDVIGAQLDRLAPSTVLEIGPGEGAAACRLARGRSYTGVELSARTRTMTAQRLAEQGTPSRMLASLEELDPNERFDLVCAFEVIEHIDDDRAALAEWCRWIRPGGALLLSTPADPDRMGPHDVIAGHFRRYRPEDLADLAREAGCVDVEVIGVGFPFGLALEAVRNRMAARTLARDAPAPAGGESADADADLAARTEASSSLMQPPAWSGAATRIASAPGRWLQRRWPDRGTGLVLVAQVPE